MRTHSITLPHLGIINRHHSMTYYEWGDPKNTNIALAIHGLSRNGRDFDMLASALSEHYRVLCPDIVGRGKSDWLKNPRLYNLTTYLSDINKLIKRLELKTINWIGTSMGGILGMMAAKQNPHLINRLVLNDIGYIIPAAGLQRIINYVGSQTQFNSLSDAQEALKKNLKSFGINNPEHWKHFFEHSIEPSENGTYRFTYDPRINQKSKKQKNISDIDLSPFWQAVKCPTLILRGEHSDILTPTIAQEMLHCGKENVSLIEVTNVGHAPTLMEQDQVDTICHWLT